MKKAKGITARLRAAKKRKADAEYAKNRIRAIQRDNGTCRHCWDTLKVFIWREPCECHHIHPRSLGVDHSIGNLVLLCKSCHDLVHAKRIFISGNADGQLTFSQEPMR